MDDTDLARIENLLDKTLDRRRTISSETHRKHHDYIDSLLDDAAMRRARREQWIRVVGGWGFVVLISSMAAAAWHYFKHKINGG